MSDEDIQQRILDAAEACFLESGLTARIHHLIAERAGVSRPTVYKHVGDQHAVLQALLDREATRFLAAAVPIFSRRGPLRDRFVDVVVFAVTYADEHPLLQKMLSEQPDVFLPWFTLHAQPVIEHAVTAMAPFVKRDPDHPTLKPQVVVEWGVRLSASLITTPSAGLRPDRAGLRRYVNALLDIGMTQPAMAN